MAREECCTNVSFDVDIFPNFVFPNNTLTLEGFSPQTTDSFTIYGYVYPACSGRRRRGRRTMSVP
jgi:hypothetical protein